MNTQFLARRRAVANQVVERMSSDPGFRQAMMSNPEGALEGVGLLEQLSAPGASEPEVMRAQPCPYSCWNTTCTSMFSV